VVQVPAGSSKMALVAPPQKIARNGYLYVYVSNESAQDVYFDDLTIKHYTGALVQEQAFYPFGLQMAAISSKAILKTTDPYKYNAGSELEEELNYYNTFYRKYDAQIGRFTGVDIRSEESAAMSVYNFGANNPVMFNDPMGDKFGRGNQLEEHPIDANWSYGSNPGIGNGFGGLGDSGGGGGNYADFWGSLVNSFSSFGEDDRFGKHNGNIGFWRTTVTSEDGSFWGSSTTGNPTLTYDFISISNTDKTNGGSVGDLNGANDQRYPITLHADLLAIDEVIMRVNQAWVQQPATLQSMKGSQVTTWSLLVTGQSYSLVTPIPAMSVQIRYNYFVTEIMTVTRKGKLFSSSSETYEQTRYATFTALSPRNRY